VIGVGKLEAQLDAVEGVRLATAFNAYDSCIQATIIHKLLEIRDNGLGIRVENGRMSAGENVEMVGLWVDSPPWAKQRIMYRLLQDVEAGKNVSDSK
jgi:hypothetical protein